MSSDSKTKDQVVDFSEARAQKMNEKRRKAERIFFQQLLNVFCETPQHEKELKPVDLVDVSEDGCSIQMPFDPNLPWPTDLKQPLNLRLYFSQDTYLPVHLKIENSRPCIEQGVRLVRYGCSVDKTTTSYSAYQQFIRFLKLYAEHAHKDQGNTTVFYI